MPFIVYKDSVNRKSNQKNIGTIRTSNLCVEIMEYVDSDNIASCTLSSNSSFKNLLNVMTLINHYLILILKN